MNCQEQNITGKLTVTGLGYYPGKQFVLLLQKNNQ